MTSEVRIGVIAHMVAPNIRTRGDAVWGRQDGGMSCVSVGPENTISLVQLASIIPQLPAYCSTEHIDVQ